MKKIKLLAGAAVGVEEEQRFDFGCVAMRPKFAPKRPQLRQKIIEIDTSQDQALILTFGLFDSLLKKISCGIKWGHRSRAGVATLFVWRAEKLPPSIILKARQDELTHE